MNESAERGSVRLVGTAHVSRKSAEEVERVVDEQRPDVVALELDEGRYRQMRGETPEDIEAGDLLKGSVAFQFLAYWLLSYVQARLGERFDIEPGADMRAGMAAADRTGAEVALVDRDIQVTVQRFWARLSATEKLRLVGGLALGATDPLTVGVGVGVGLGIFVGLAASALAGPFLLGGAVTAAAGVPVVGSLLGFGVGLLDGAVVGAAGGAVLGGLLALVLAMTAPTGEEMESVDIEQMTDADVVTAMLEEFRRFSPGGAEALIDERDAYIAHHLVALRQSGADVVAVVGAGHREGIERYLADPSTLPPMSSLVGRERGGRFSLGKALGYLLTLGFAVFFGLLVLAGINTPTLLGVFAAWFLFNGVFAAGLALLAGAHPMSALVGGLVAWLTSLNPLLAPGWFAGYVELRKRPVNIADIGKLNEILGDEESPIGEVLSRMLGVPLFRLIAVVAVTNIGSMVASLLFPVVVLPLFGPPFDSVGAVTGALQDGLRNGVDILLGLGLL